MKTAKILATIAFGMVSTLSAQTVDSTDSIPLEGIETSHPHRMPKLISLETAEIVESYGIGFSGGGNIHRDLFRGKGFAGTAYVGLGDVAELGYSMEEVRTTGIEPNRLTRGHIKLAVLKESPLLPTVSVGYGSTLAGSLVSEPVSGDPGERCDLERGVVFVGASKSFQVSAWRIGLHPSLQYVTDELKDGARTTAHLERFEPALALTWQQTPQVMYMAEAKWGDAVDLETLSSDRIDARREIETNLGVRFYLRNWLFMDAGIRHSEIPSLERKSTGIHANFSGVVPLKSLGNRLTRG